MDGPQTKKTTSISTDSVGPSLDGKKIEGRIDDGLDQTSDTEGTVVEQILKLERERIATLLHDDVLQAFATCLLKAQLCERLVQLERFDQVTKELPLLEDALSDTIDRVRDLAVMLKRPGDEPA